TAHLGGDELGDAPARLGGPLPGRADQFVSGVPGMAATRRRVDPPRGRYGAGDDLGPADPSHRWPPRDPLPRVRLAGLPRVLPRLEGVDPSDDLRGRRPLPARRLFPAVG